MWSSGQPIKDAIRYNRRLRRFLDQEGLSEAAWFEEEPSVTVPELSAGPWYSITTTGWRFFVVEGAIYFASCHEESMTFDHAPTLEQWLAARLADLGV